MQEKIQKILFASHFREMAYNSLEALFVLKKTGLNLIVLCHIIPREEVGFVPFGGYLKKEADELKEEALIKFEDWQKAINRAGIESRIVIEVGDPAHGVARTAHKEKADMLAIGKGPLSLDIATRCRMPVLIQAYMAPFQAGGERAVRENRLIFDKPLLAAGSPQASRRALLLLESLAGAVEKAAVAHVIDKKALSSPEIEKIKKDETLRLEGYCDVLQKPGIAAEPHLLAGNPAEELINEARASACSMIIAASSDREGQEDAPFGSVARKLCEISEFPVLLVPFPPLPPTEDLD